MQTPRDILPGYKINSLTPLQEGIAYGLRKFYKVENLNTANRRIQSLLQLVNRRELADRSI